jgi:hypothetical protein
MRKRALYIHVSRLTEICKLIFVTSTQNPVSPPPKFRRRFTGTNKTSPQKEERIFMQKLQPLQFVRHPHRVLNEHCCKENYRILMRLFLFCTGTYSIFSTYYLDYIIIGFLLHRRHARVTCEFYLLLYCLVSYNKISFVLYIPIKCAA